MQASEFLAAAARLAHGDVHALARGGGLVVVAPHPDDESLGCGGVVAAAVAACVEVRIVVVSDGIGSHPNSPTFPPARLRDLRQTETLAAVAELGVGPHDVRFLRLPDREVPTEGPNADAAVDAIVAAAQACNAGAILVTWHHDPHCDHAAAHALVMRARAGLERLKVYAYPVWGWTLPAEHEVGDAPTGMLFDTKRYRGAKARAIAAHRSQVGDLIDDDPDGFRLPAAMIDRSVEADEIFLLQADAEEDA